MRSDREATQNCLRFLSSCFIIFLITLLIQSCGNTLDGTPTKLVALSSPPTPTIMPTLVQTISITPTLASEDDGLGHDDIPQISIDSLPPGNYIAYCSFYALDQDGDPVNSLFVIDVKGELFGRLAYNACRSSISSDGRTLLIDRMDYSIMDHYLVLIDLVSGQERVVSNSDGCSEGSFGPSNDRIVTACQNNIFVIERVSGSKRMIDDCEARGGACGSPVWSPDGRYIIYDYLQSFSPNSGVFLLETECIESITDCSPSRIASPNFGFYSWSPDSTVVASLAEEGAITLFEIPSGKTQKLYLPVTASARGIAFSPNGRELAITLEGDQKESYRIFLFNLEDGEAKYIGDSTYHKGVMFWLDRP